MTGLRGIALLLAAGLALGGCAAGGVAGYAPGIVGGGGGLPATRAVGRSDQVTPPGRRDLGLAVRAVAVETDGTPVQVAGATCRITSGTLEATIVTPGRLVIPDLGPDAQPVRADCTAGTLAGAATAAPGFFWPAEGGNPPQRVSWGLGWTYGFQKVGPMRYPDLVVPLAERR
jgi:hypothetical protein